VQSKQRNKPQAKMTRREIDRAVRAFDFVDFLENHNVEGRENRSGEFRGTCPFCENSSRNPFCVNVDSGLYYCHHCPERGGPIQLISNILKVGYDKALDYLTDHYSAFEEDTDDDFAEPVVTKITLPDEFYRLADSHDSLSAKPYLNYVRERGLDDATIARFGIGYCDSGFYSGRVIVPVTHLGQVVSFIARAIGTTAKGKILTPPGNEQSNYCFNLDNIWGTKEVLVVEGVFDAMVLPELAVATFGKKISPMQVSLLKKSGVESVTFCYDEDALDELWDFTEKYMFLLKAKLILLPKGKDPSKLGRKKMLQLLPTAKHIAVGGLRGA